MSICPSARHGFSENDRDGDQARIALSAGLTGEQPLPRRADEDTDRTNRIAPEELERLLMASELRLPPGRPTAAPGQGARFLVAMAIALSAGMLGGVYLRAPGTASGVSPSAPTPAPTPPQPASVPAPPPPMSAAEVGARAALQELREGIRRCVTGGLHRLPGTSPAVPARLSQIGHHGLRVAPAEWRTPVWACAKFRVDEPMRFQLQWQFAKSEGLGVAWLDDDGDGVSDRSLAFRATLRGRDLDFTDVAPAEEPQPVVLRFRTATVRGGK